MALLEFFVALVSMFVFLFIVSLIRLAMLDYFDRKNKVAERTKKLVELLVELKKNPNPEKEKEYEKENKSLWFASMRSLVITYIALFFGYMAFFVFFSNRFHLGNWVVIACIIVIGTICGFLSQKTWNVFQPLFENSITKL